MNFLRFLLTCFPIIFSQFIVHIPSPGRSEIISCSLIIEPDVKSLDKANKNDLTFFDSKKYKNLANQTQALFCITTKKSSSNAMRKIVVPIDMLIRGIQKGIAKSPGLISSKIKEK